MIQGLVLKTLHDMWVKNIIEPSHIISYLDRLDYTLGYIALGRINIISKNKKTTHTWKISTKS
tara:strand:+ start:213 stop:401 length:189 start_codon:yes stop_codon:yes gene_type:complete